ncbi:ABC transporter permease [Actinoplanes missouriensis]|uniref:ABC transporter permease n=1 Tax=Actinoplanes missouriensis TaxID=1866 RepID=UPI0034041853
MTAATTSASPDAIDRILDDVEPQRQPGPLANALALAWRVMVKTKRSPGQLFNATLTPVMFTLIFTYLFGGALSDSSRSDYLQWLLPGVIVQGVLFISTQTGVGLSTDLREGIFDRFKSMPIWRPSPLVGILLGDLVRYAISAVVVLAVGLALGFRPSGGFGVVAALLIILLFGFSVSWIWTLVGLVLRTPEAVSGLGMLLLTVLTFASNIFVDPETMPGWLQGFVAVNPVSLVVTAARGLMAGEAPGELAGVFISCAALLAVFVPLSLARYRRS